MQADEGGVIVLDENADIELVKNSNFAFILFNKECGEVNVNVEYTGDDIKCEEAIGVRNEEVSRGFFHIIIFFLILF